MNLKLEFDVTLTQHESGAYLASCAEFPGKVGIGDTPEQALADLKAFVLTPVPPLPLPAAPTPAGGNPWLEVIGTWKGDPLIDEWRRAVEEYREAKDREEEPER